MKNRGEGGLSPGHGERGSASRYRGLGAEPSAGVQGAEPPVGVGAPLEAECSVAFEAPAEEPNLTFVFAKSVVFGGG